MVSLDSKKRRLLPGLAYAGVAAGTYFLLAALLPIWHAPKADHCALDQAGIVVPDRTANGIWSKAAGMFYLHREGVDDVVVASCFGKGGCKGPISEVEGHVGEPARVEFCRRTIIRVELSGVVVFNAPPSQDILDARMLVGRKFLFWYGGLCLLAGLFALVRSRKSMVALPSP